MTKRWLSGTSAVLMLVLAGAAGAASPADGSAAASATPSTEVYRSYLRLPNQGNVMFHDGLDSDEVIGSQVVSPTGARLATVTDLLVEVDGRVRWVVIDPGSALGAGSRHVIVPIEELRRTEAGSGVLSLDISNAELGALPTYRQVGSSWEPIP